MKKFSDSSLKRVLSLLLAIVMMIGLVPTNALAEVEPANWVEDVETARYWPIPHQGRLVKVSHAEPLKNPSLRYIGGYTRPDGREVIRLAFSAYSTATSAVWERMILKPDHNLEGLIDWTESGMGKKLPTQGKNNHDGWAYNEEFIKFQPVSAQQGGSGDLHVMDIARGGTFTVNTGTVGTHYEVPIDLVMKKDQTVKKLDKNPLIQMRLMDSNYESIYSTTISENAEVPYSSYTMSTFVPVRVNLKQGIINTDVVRNYENVFQSSSSYIKYNEEKGYFDVYMRRTQGTVGSVADVGGSMNSGSSENRGDYGFMQSFDESLIDILKPQDESGTVIQLFSADSNDNLHYPSTDPTVPKPANRIDYSKDQIERRNGVGIVKYSSNDPNKTFLPGGPTLTGYGNSTVVRYFVDKDKLKEKFGSSDIISYEFFSTLFATNKTGVEEFKSVTRNEDINLKRGDTIDIRFDGRRDLITYGTFDTQGSFIQIGDDQYKISLRTTEDKAKYVGGTGNYMRKMTVWVPFDIKIKKDTPLTIFSRKTKLQEVSPGMTVTFNYSAQDDSGSKVTKQKTYRFEREFSKPGYTMNDKGEVFFEGKKVNDPQNTLFKDNHDPLMSSRQENFDGGILTRTADAPDIDEIFTDSEHLTGRSKYDRVFVYPYDADKREVKTAKRLGTIQASDQKIEMNVNGDDVQGFEWTSATNDADHKINPDYWATKDMPLYFTNQDVLSNSLESKDPVMEQVQAKVTFNLNGGTLGQSVLSYKGVDKGQKVGTEHAYITDRTNQQEEVVRIAPMNVKFANVEGYVANGFEGENVKLADHNGKKFEENIVALSSAIARASGEQKTKLQGELERTKKALELRKFVAESPKVSGKTFLGWTTKPLTGTPQEVTEAFTKLKVADSVDKYLSGDNLIFTSTSPITKNMTVYAAYGSPLVNFHTNPPAGLKGKTDETVTQSLTEQNLTDRSVRLQKNWSDPKFKMDGYSLVGYSTDPNADIPDENKTGTGVNVDNYLRDGDQFPLTADQVRDGVDLYAVWRKNYHVDVEKVWDQGTDKDKNIGKLSVGLLARPAVGAAGFEIVDQNAVYRPVPGSVQALTSATPKTGKINWNDLPSYDEAGHRMSYIAVELTDSTKALFEKGSINYKDYGATIVNTNQNQGKGGYKAQLVNTDGVDAMSAATMRSHYTKDGKLINPNDDKTMKYFDTYGYSIKLTNSKVDVQPPTIDPIKYDATQVVVRKVGNPSKIVTTLPNGQTVTVVKHDNGSYVFDQVNSTFTETVKVDANGVITIQTGQMQAGQIVKAQQFKVIGEAETPSSTTEAKVEAQPVSHKVEEKEQLPKDKDGNSVVEFNVPNHPLLPPKEGSKYTLGYFEGEDENKKFVPLAPVDAKGNIAPVVLDKDMVSDDSTEVKKQILIPESKFGEINKLKEKGIELVIQSDEAGKKPNYSDGFTLDLTAPTADAKTKEDMWRRWANVDLSNFKEDTKVIVVKYKNNAGTQILRLQNEAELKATIEMLNRNGFKDADISLEDRFGNATALNPKYDPSKIIDIMVRKERIGKDFVQVRAYEEGVTVTVRIYNAADLEDVRTKADDYQAKAKVTTQATVGKKYQKIMLKDPQGKPYKLQAGEIIEIIGTNKTGAYTNPYAKVLGQ
ncbi:Uncharacterised protein [Peptostreptococcus anaerobius]|uniref:Uncharacterized protein n=1 Tax=Peptostreptococcus anaerobius TaxID=1261 RepID=A0A379CGU4_9FIRM|nr:hypothetical protein [Peptostreptococcus anaerobius]SFM90908.1 hypothetical protein SAMN05660467_00775 [Peptostreptococcus anaerobius]SUB61314.1 Uncharacterised protein [Peptostreptococcus anaerobius]